MKGHPRTKANLSEPTRRGAVAGRGTSGEVQFGESGVTVAHSWRERRSASGEGSGCADYDTTRRVKPAAAIAALHGARAPRKVASLRSSRRPFAGRAMVDTRRRLLLGGCIAATGAAAGAWLWRRTATGDPPSAHGHDLVSTAAPAGAAGTPAAYTPFEQPLRLPGVDGLMADVRLAGAMTLRASTAAFPIFAGAATTVWHYAGEVAGRGVANPVLRIARGQTLDIALDNALAEATTAHWHGLHVDEA